MAGLTDTFGKEKRTRFLEMFLPLAAGIGASFMPNGGQALQGLGTVLSGSFGRRADEAKLRQQDTEFEAMKSDADSQLNALNAELARVEGTPYEYNPDWSPERNRLAAAERNAKISNLKTQIKTTGDTFAAIMDHAAQTRDPAKAIAALGVFMNSVNSMSGLEDQLGLWFAKHGVEANEENIRNEDQQMQRDQASRAAASFEREGKWHEEATEMQRAGLAETQKRTRLMELGQTAKQTKDELYNAGLQIYDRISPIIQKAKDEGMDPIAAKDAAVKELPLPMQELWLQFEEHNPMLLRQLLATGGAGGISAFSAEEIE